MGTMVGARMLKLKDLMSKNLISKGQRVERASQSSAPHSTMGCGPQIVGLLWIWPQGPHSGQRGGRSEPNCTESLPTTK